MTNKQVLRLLTDLSGLTTPEVASNLVKTPWQNTDNVTAVMRAIDNLIATYGQDFVLDLINEAYETPKYQDKA